MKNFTIRLARQYFTICPVCDYIREYCKDWNWELDLIHQQPFGFHLKSW